MAKIYTEVAAVPAPEPDYKNYDWELEEKREKEYLEALAAYLRECNAGDLVGKEIHTPRGDGYARYMVVSHKPFALLHLALGDAWRADEIWERGIRLSDAREMVNRRESKKNLFGAV